MIGLKGKEEKISSKLEKVPSWFCEAASLYPVSQSRVTGRTASPMSLCCKRPNEDDLFLDLLREEADHRPERLHETEEEKVTNERHLHQQLASTNFKSLY